VKSLRNFTSSIRSKRSKQVKKNGADRRGRLHDETILVPIDFTTASYEALDYALSMAKRLSWSVTLVHVVGRNYGEGLVDLIPKTDLRAKARREAQGKLDVLAAAKTHLPTRSIVRDGLPEYEILEIAEKIKAKMIILGRQDRNPLSRLIFGSVTRDILEMARCPVLVINSGTDSKVAAVSRIFWTN
jgi:nucleotide-binding universal stress UspA family protein